MAFTDYLRENARLNLSPPRPLSIRFQRQLESCSSECAETPGPGRSYRGTGNDSFVQ